MAKPKLYYALFSPPARACILTAKIIGLDLDLRFVDFAKKEHLGEEFLKINPQHTIPVLVDGNDIIWESHAIITYMVSKYAKDDSLYPKDFVKRAHVDQRLHFETGILFHALKDFVNRIVYGSEKEYNESSVKLAHTAYDFLEKFLKDGEYMTGNTLTVADISIYVTAITLKKLVPIEKRNHPLLTAWMGRMKNLPNNEEINEKGAEHLFVRIQNYLHQNQAKVDLDENIKIRSYE